MPLGMENSPASFQRLINKVIAYLEGCEAYNDDVIIYSDTREEHLRIILKFFEILSRAMMTIRREGASLLFSPIRPRPTQHYQCDVT